MIVRGMVSSTVAVALATFSVTVTVIELGPAGEWAFGVPDNTPAEDSFRPVGRLTWPT